MTTREHIIQTADLFIRDRGYNAFSFSDISTAVQIKKASVHYHFPQKTDLGVAVIQWHIETLSQLIEQYQEQPADIKLNRFLAIYTDLKSDNKVCLVGSLATDLNTVDGSIKEKLAEFAELFLNWVSSFLAEGRSEGIFQFEGSSRDQALMIITNLLAIVQLSRLTHTADFDTVKERIKADLKLKSLD